MYTDACGAVQGTSVVGGAGGLTYVEEVNASVNLSIKIEIKRLNVTMTLLSKRLYYV